MATFGAPKSSNAYSVNVTGTVAAHSIAHVMINLAVTNTGTHARSDAFYQEVDYSNTTFTDTAFHGTYAVVITPKLYGTDTVQTSINLSY